MSLPRSRLFVRQPQYPATISPEFRTWPVVINFATLRNQGAASTEIPPLLLGGAIHRPNIGGSGALTGNNTNSGYVSLGSNTALPGDVQSGLIVWVPSQVGSNTVLFTTSNNPYSTGNGLCITQTTTGAIELARHNSSVIMTSAVGTTAGGLNAVAWSYNASTGRARVALNGRLSTATSAQTLTHTTRLIGRFSTANNANCQPADILFFANRAAEEFNDDTLVRWSLNPWQVFEEPEQAFYFRAAGGATTYTATASLSAAIQIARTATASLSAAVRAERTASASLSAAARAEQSASATLTTAIQAARTATASLTAAVQAARTGAVSADVAVQAARTATATLTAALQEARSATASVGAVVMTPGQVTASLSAAVRAAQSATVSLSAYVQAGTSLSAQLDAAVLQARSASASVDVAVALRLSATAALSAAVAIRNAATVGIDVGVLARRTATAALSAYIVDESVPVYAAITPGRAARGGASTGQRPAQLSTRRRIN